VCIYYSIIHGAVFFKLQITTETGGRAFWEVNMELLDQTKKDLLESSKIIAMVGLSPKTDKPSNRVANYLKTHGYRVIPVNPQHEEILGEKSY
jgi:hypothetical protein